jgi:uncharacterized caspase-like protein
VIAVGADAYRTPSANLEYAANDADLVVADLPQRLATHYSAVVPIALTSRTDGRSPLLATKTHLEMVLKRLAGLAVDDTILREIPGASHLQAVTPQDLVILYVASHGLADSTGEFFLFLSDSDPRDPHPASRRSAISSTELSDWLGPVDAGDLILIVDACHGAAVVDTDGFKPGPMGSAGLGQLAYNKGMRVLAATQASNTALESHALRHGLLTFALVEEGLRLRQSDRAPRDGRATMAEWLRYGEMRVPELHESLAGRPVLRASDLSRGVKRPGGPAATSLQQPRLFDYRRGGPDIQLSLATR